MIFTYIFASRRKVEVSCRIGLLGHDIHTGEEEMTSNNNAMTKQIRGKKHNK